MACSIIMEGQVICLNPIDKPESYKCEQEPLA